MCPILEFEFFSMLIEVPAYSFFAALGAILGVLTGLLFLRREGLSLLRSLLLLFCMALSFLIGARLFNFAVNSSAYGGNLQVYTLKLVGLSLYGGISGAFIAFLFLTRILHWKPWPLLDALVLPSAVAFASARAGCFFNGCCSGMATHSVFGVVFPVRQSEEPFLSALKLLGKTSIAVYPTQLFEMSLALIGLIPAMWLYLSRKTQPGTVFLLYGIWFTAMRWVILPLRNLPYSKEVTHVALPILYGGLILAGFLILWKKIRKK